MSATLHDQVRRLDAAERRWLDAARDRLRRAYDARRAGRQGTDR
jgi:hypothetical protein